MPPDRKGGIFLYQETPCELAVARTPLGLFEHGVSW